MAKKMIGVKLKREIEFSLLAYLEKRLRVSCDLLKDSLKETPISLDEYVSDLQNINKILKSLRNDDTRTREKYEYEDTINMKRVNMINQVLYRVIPSEENIREILELVKYYLNNYPLPKSESLNEALFLRLVMNKLRHDKRYNIREKGLKYYSYFNCSKDSCFNEHISGRISFGYGSIISISNQDSKVVFRVDENKRISVTYCPFDDFILFRDSMVLVSFNDVLVPLREVDGYYHDFLCTGELYQARNPERQNYVEIYKSLEEYLAESGLMRFDRKIISIQEASLLMNVINPSSISEDAKDVKAQVVAKKNNGN